MTVPTGAVQTFAQIGITLPRTAAAQQNWVAQGNGYQVPLGQERPGDLVFTDSYLAPNRVGHVMIVFDPAEHLTIESGGSRVGHYDYGYHCINLRDYHCRHH